VFGLAGAYDLLMSEFGAACPDDITERWTPAQAVVAMEAIHRRRAARLAEETQAMYVTMAAAQGGKKAFKAYRGLVKGLLRQAGQAPDTTTAEDVAAAMGLKQAGAG
jgi:hypothetical protein